MSTTADDASAETRRRSRFVITRPAVGAYRPQPQKSARMGSGVRNSMACQARNTPRCVVWSFGAKSETRSPDGVLTGWKQQALSAVSSDPAGLLVRYSKATRPSPDLRTRPDAVGSKVY